jgi:small subunit ribosomal protein S14
MVIAGMRGSATLLLKGGADIYAEQKVFAIRRHPAIFRAPEFTSMAKTCWLEREKRKSATVAKYAALRAELKAKGDYVGLSQLPRNASPARLSRRCQATGRKRGYIGRFKLSRISFRELASNGLIPGVTKSSW